MQVESDWGNSCFWLKTDYRTFFQLSRQEIERLKTDIEIQIQNYDELEEIAKNNDEMQGL